MSRIERPSEQFLPSVEYSPLIQARGALSRAFRPGKDRAGDGPGMSSQWCERDGPGMSSQWSDGPRVPASGVKVHGSQPVEDKA